MTRNIVFSLALGAALAACDGIPADDRYIEMEAVKVERTVLLEDFTGQGCVNCPAAHKVIEALEKQYGRNFIAVSIHAGPFGVPADNKRYTGLMQEEGQIYNGRYGIVDYPQGVLDGRLPSLNDDQWAAAVYDEISVKTPVSITVNPNYYAVSGQIYVECTVSSTEVISGSLVVWIVESGIVARQEDINEGRIPDYVHNNVFRACANGINGEPISVGPDDPYRASCSIEVKNTDTEKWNVGNLSVVVFLRTSAGILQAASAKVEQ